MTTTLRYAPNLVMPVDAVTQRFSFLGRIGSGKTYGATKLMELMLEAGAQCIALDPVGTFYGLRIAGKGKGFTIPVFGGLHADIPLHPVNGAAIADLVVDHGLSCVLDVSQMESDADKARFAAAFARRFFQRKKASPSAVHLFIEECQEFVPQNPGRGEEMMLHEFTRMAKLGRNFGIGLSLLTQRPQEVNKKVLNLTECLLAFQMTGAHERKAIRDWITDKGADEKILDLLPTLKVGTAYVYSPQWLQVSERVECYPKRTADVSSTPAVNAAPVEAKPLTPVDLGKLRTEMAAAIEEAKANDPVELKKEVAALKKQLATAPSPAAVTDPKVIARAVAAAVRKYQDQLMAVERSVAPMLRLLEDLVGKVDAVQKAAAIELIEILPPAAPPARETAVRTAQPAKVSHANNVDITPGALKLLNAVAKFASMSIARPTRTQAAALAPMSPTSSATERYFAELTKGGYLLTPEPGVVELSQTGAAAATPVSTPPTLAQYHDEWRRLLGEGAERKLFDAVANAVMGPDKFSRESLAKLARISSTSSATERGFAWLIGLDLLQVAGKGLVTPGRTMFPEGLK